MADESPIPDNAPEKTAPAKDGNAPWLSVIIPVYNDGGIAVNAIRATLIAADAVDSDNADVEILCVEGGSTDDSVQRIQAVVETDPRIRLVRCPSGAVAPKFNLGAREARGNWLAFTESDCVPDPGWIAAWKRIVDEGRLKACAGRVIAASDDPNLQLSIRDATRRAVIRPSFWRKTVPFYYGQGNNFLIHRELFLELGGVDERLGAGAPGGSGQDAELNFRLLDAGHAIGFEPAALVVHHPVETRESFLRKKRNYYFAGAWWIVALHLSSPACLTGLMLRAVYPPAAMISALITFRMKKFRRHLEEYKGFWHGLAAGIRYRRSRGKRNAAPVS